MRLVISLFCVFSVFIASQAFADDGDFCDDSDKGFSILKAKEYMDAGKNIELSGVDGGVSDFCDSIYSAVSIVYFVENREFYKALFYAGEIGFLDRPAIRSDDFKNDEYLSIYKRMVVAYVSALFYQARYYDLIMYMDSLKPIPEVILDSNVLIEAVGISYGRLGLNELAIDIWEQYSSIGLRQGDQVVYYVSLYNIACRLSNMGDYEEAFEHLKLIPKDNHWRSDKMHVDFDLRGFRRSKYYEQFRNENRASTK